MSRQFVSHLTDGEAVDSVFLASEKQLRPNRAGQLYLQLRVSDKTGSLNTMMWNATQNDYDSFNNGDFVLLNGTAQLFNGNMQIIAKKLHVVPKSKIDESDFETISSQKIDELLRQLSTELRTLQCDHLRSLAESFLVDEQLMARFRRAPAGVKNHHAYSGGLLQHVVSLIQLVRVVTPLYEQLNPDMMVMGAFLHDIGKIEELTYEPDLGYSDAGQLVGHIVQGVTILENKIRDTERLTGEQFPQNLRLQLQHIIVSHHGEYEFGSPKLPMTFEALAIHHLDNLDAKIANFTQLINEDANTHNAWTTYNPQLGRKIFKQPITKSS